MLKIGTVGAVSLLVLAACTPVTRDFERQEVQGPPEFNPAAAARHARQFEEDVPVRSAGSQEEQAAASYITGILQKNGYLVRLEAVPVPDEARSSVLIAQPPSGDDIERLVVVSYDTPPTGPADNGAIGTFLELSRALSVAAPDHDAHFAALGADNTELAGGALGSRRLAQILLDEDQEPEVIRIASASGAFFADGSLADELYAIAEDAGMPTEDGIALVAEPGVFEEAGFDVTTIAGRSPVVGEVLLAYLAAASS